MREPSQFDLLHRAVRDVKQTITDSYADLHTIDQSLDHLEDQGKCNADKPIVIVSLEDWRKFRALVRVPLERLKDCTR